MLVTKRSAGVKSLVNLRNPLHTGDEAHKWAIHPAFDTEGRDQKQPKIVVLVSPHKGLYPSKFFEQSLKKKLHMMTFHNLMSFHKK